MQRPRAKLAVRTLALALSLCAACGDETASAPPGPAPMDPALRAVRAARDTRPQLPRSRDPRLAEGIAALERGDLPVVSARLLELGETEAPDSICLRARLLAAQGDPVGAVRELDQAKLRFPDQGSIFAAAAEIHAAAGRLSTAQEEIRAGLAAAGPCPELSRARGVYMLLQSGGAQAGLAHLLEARAGDAEIPYCLGPLAEAHRLLAIAALAKPEPALALAHVREGLAAEPDHPELLLLRADALLAAGDFDQALPAYEELARAGRNFGASLRGYYLKGAMAALVEGRPALATERYTRARELGADNAELGFGAEVLARELADARQRGERAYDAGDFATLRAQMERVLRLEPGDLAARNQLGVACFRSADPAAAAAAWSAVLEQAERDAIELPDPVHLNLAKALHAMGKLDEIRPLLEAYLARHSQGAWVEQTREALARVP